MKTLNTLFLCLIILSSNGQRAKCFCDKDTLMNDETVSCDTTTLSDKSKLYWQFDCDRIWLTLENVNHRKVVIDELPVELYGYTYRLGFHLIKEFEANLLFRAGCGASGPCKYWLIDKSSGSKLKELSHLICVDTDSQWEGSESYPYEFIVYLSEASNNLSIYYIDKDKILVVPFTDKLTAAIPEQQFNKMTLKENVLSIFYETQENGKKKMEIDLSGKTYSR